jgi:electron-transferring-flavoprotein dehydrogenase
MVSNEEMEIFYSKNGSVKVPLWLLPKKYQNHKNYLISLGELCSWMGSKADEFGVDLITGYSGDEFIFNE